ncbi:MAG: hypothetical protein EBR73_17670 [Rhodobacteraceae bacterium]|nr:hypothetical protein [Paracoccaceae bacterium]
MTHNSANPITKDISNEKLTDEEMLRRLGCLETQLNDFAIMLGQHNKQIYRMSIIISDLMKRLESKDNQNL